MKRLFLLITAIAFLTSCETDVTDEITLNGETPRLVMEGGIERNTTNPVSAQRILLTTTVDFLDEGQSQPVEDAIVSINDGQTDYLFTHTEDGIYLNAEIPAELNRTYTITISWNGETYVGSDSLNEVAEFDDVYSEFEEETLITDEGYFVKFDSTDPVNIENYYYYRAFRNGEFIIIPDPGNSATLVESDEFFDGQQRFGVNPNEEVIYELGDTAIVQQLGISEEYHDYLLQLFERTGNQIPIIGNPPPASIRSNIVNTTVSNNKILGFFYAADVEEESLIISE
ncbi:MAG: DUF4249 domain-containing protein [Bacteroidota bacterium]